MAILAVLTSVRGLSQAPVSCPGVLSEQQLTTVLTGKVLEPRVLQFIRQCGIGFEVTAWAERRLRKAGATTAVVNAARALVDQQREWRRMKFEFVKVAPGEFTMGCSAGDTACDDAEKPAHRVRITRGFEIGRYEVTQAMWESVMGSSPSHFRGFSDRPVERVTGDDIQQFLQRLNARKDGYRYRLPTEAEWEYRRARREHGTAQWTVESCCLVPGEFRRAHARRRPETAQRVGSIRCARERVGTGARGQTQI